MHEMSLAEGVVGILQDQAKAQDFKRVITVWLDIGELSHVSPEAMEFCFDAVTKGTIAEGAKLEIIRTPGRAWCYDCDVEIQVPSLIDPCPQCGGFKVQVTQGQEMRVREVEVA